jgi:hypothetical protein
LRGGLCEGFEGPAYYESATADNETESLTVNGRTFRFSQYDIAPGFRGFGVEEKIIESGDYVRIHFFREDIARLEWAPRNQARGVSAVGKQETE